MSMVIYIERSSVNTDRFTRSSTFWSAPFFPPPQRMTGFDGSSLVLWLFSSIAGAILAFRLTGRIWVALVGQFLCFHVLKMLALEPGHPVSLIVAIFGIIVLCLDGRKRVPPGFWSAITIGIALGALLMIKINIGLFAVAALGAAWIYHSPLDKAGKIARCITVILLCLPLWLTRTWPVETRTFFAVIFICSLLSVLTCARQQTIEWKFLFRSGKPIAGGAIGTCAACLLVALLTGSRWRDIIDGIISSPLRLGSVFSFAPTVGPLTAFAAVVGLLLAMTWRLLCRTFSIDQARFLFALRLSFLTMVLAWLVTAFNYFFWVSFFWIAALPLDLDSENSNTGRWRLAQLSLALLAVAQILGVYPVAGAQYCVPLYLGAASALFVIAGLLADLKAIAEDLFPWRLAARTVVAIGLSIVLIGLFWHGLRRAAARYADFLSLDLPGAQLLRADELSVATYRFLAVNLRESHPSFLTMPAWNSLYLWSQREAPAGINSTMNFSLLSLDRQRKIVNVARTCRPIAAVFNREIFNFWGGEQFPPSGPLIDFVRGECRSVGRVNKFELMTLRDASPPALTLCVTLDQEWQPNAPINQITVRLPANLGTITSASILDTSRGSKVQRLLETTIPSDYLAEAQEGPTAKPRQFSFPLNGPVPSRDSLDQLLLQLKGDSGQTVTLPFLRPPVSRE